MKALQIHAGPAALRHMRAQGLSAHDVRVIPAAAGGPKGLILGPLDRFIFGQWLPQSAQPVDLIGASIGAWRMASACRPDVQQALAAFEQVYLHQRYDPSPGRKRPTPAQVSDRFVQYLHDFFAGQAHAVVHHPRYRLHLVAARGRHLLARERAVLTPLGYLGAFAANAVHRRALSAWMERVVFSSPRTEAAGAPPAALPFATHDVRTRHHALSPTNFLAALQASCSIPMVLQAVRHIAGAPSGAYWDGSITDYHMHLHYHASAVFGAINSIAENPINSHGNADLEPQKPGVVLYPHFQAQLVPGWLDKAFKRRHRATPALDAVVLLSPRPEWVQRLPHGKLPDRNDFTHYGRDVAARARVWATAISAAEQMADEWAQWLRQPDMGAVLPL